MGNVLVEQSIMGIDERDLGISGGDGKPPEDPKYPVATEHEYTDWPEDSWSQSSELTTDEYGNVIAVITSVDGEGTVVDVNHINLGPDGVFGGPVNTAPPDVDVNTDGDVPTDPETHSGPTDPNAVDPPIPADGGSNVAYTSGHNRNPAGNLESFQPMGIGTREGHNDLNHERSGVSYGGVQESQYVPPTYLRNNLLAQ